MLTFRVWLCGRARDRAHVHVRRHWSVTVKCRYASVWLSVWLCFGLVGFVHVVGALGALGLVPTQRHNARAVKISFDLLSL